MFSVEDTYPVSSTEPDSAPQPCGRHTFTVGLLPSGPEPVPTTKKGCLPPDTSQTSVDLAGQGINIGNPAASKGLPNPSSNFALCVLTISDDR